ncbi:hypothetical protein [Pseudorhodobacter sp.]|uniref:hypothetical protein n=1 Tax=Pseudorhodobacter sp. TaxID=1934400 RepID=UPI0026484F51|nr:hypothetical protein [Pseudorhodobacter sp.]MDN5786831.1 hypothetical protein [Pseudorhodobacter sp.]
MIAQPTLSPDASPLPPGFDPLRKACDVAAGGIFIETDHHVLAYLPGKDRLVVTFDNLSSDREVENRQPFAAELVRRQGWGILGVMMKRKDWFQCPQLKTQMLALKGAGLFESYPEVSLYGSSMGGFGAAVFASLAPGCTVLALAPQTSLDQTVAPFETRYRYGRSLGDWSAPFHDAAEGIRHAARAYIIYDPQVAEDRLHAERMAGGGTLLLPVPHFTHKIPPMFKRMEVLKDVAMMGMSGQLDPLSFRRLMRKRRVAVPYLLTMIGAAVARGRLDLAAVAANRAHELVPNWKLRKLQNEIRLAQAAAAAE